MKEETKLKIKQTKLEGNAVLGKMCGYEISVDKSSFQLCKDGVTFYYSCLNSLFWDLNNIVNQKSIRNPELATISKDLEKREEKFLKELGELLGDLRFVDSEDLVNKLK